MLAGNVTFSQKFCHKITHHLGKAPTSKLFQLYCHRQKASDKVQLSLMGAFQRSKDKALTLPLKSPNGYLRNQL